MSKILEKAQELGNLLVNSDEYSAMEKAENILENDQEALKLLNSFEEKQQQFANDRSNKELKEELQSLQEEMLANEKVNNYMNIRLTAGSLFSRQKPVSCRDVSG